MKKSTQELLVTSLNIVNEILKAHPPRENHSSNYSNKEPIKPQTLWIALGIGALLALYLESKAKSAVKKVKKTIN